MTILIKVKTKPTTSTAIIDNNNNNNNNNNNTKAFIYSTVNEDSKLNFACIQK